MQAAREAGATDGELRQAIRMALKVRQVKLDNHEKFSTLVSETLKELLEAKSSGDEA